MDLSQRWNEDMKQAMKSQDKFKLSTIRMVRSAIKNVEINEKRTLNDNDVLEILGREIKQRKDALHKFEKAGRNNLADSVRAEIAILTPYLPAQLSEEKIIVIVQETIQETGVSSKADMGKVMGALMPKVKGRADGKLVNTVVQQYMQATISLLLNDETIKTPLDARGVFLSFSKDETGFMKSTYYDYRIYLQQNMKGGFPPA